MDKKSGYDLHFLRGGEDVRDNNVFICHCIVQYPAGELIL